jgi:hypothetical protein
MITYEVMSNDDDDNPLFWVGHRDENGEWWDATTEPFDNWPEAEAFRKEIQEVEDAT